MNVSQIISKFGGARPLARLLDFPPTTVGNWKIRNSIPAKYQATILKAAQKQGLNIGPEDLIAAAKPKTNGNSHATK